MNPSILKKLQQVVARYDELKNLLSDPEITNDLNRFKELSKEYAHLESLTQTYRQFERWKVQLEETKALLQEEDAEMQQLAKGELKQIEEELEKCQQELTIA